MNFDETGIIMKKITALSRKSMMQIKKIMEPFGLSASEEPFFIAINQFEGSTQEELTRIVAVDKAATSRVLQSLERKGFIIRQQDIADRRQNRIYPTEAAKELFPVAWEALVAFDNSVSRNLSDECIATVYKALQVIEKNFNCREE